jgi:chromosome partitioning protein
MGSTPPASADGRRDEASAVRIVAVANLKGGTGKSTLAVNLACFAAQAHGQAVLVDADPQGTASAWLDGGLPDGRPAGLLVEVRPIFEAADAWAERIFRLAESGARIVIDMPPQLGPGFDAVLHLADALMVPVTPSAIDLRATAKTLQRLKRVQRLRGNRPACLLVPNRVDQRTAIGRTIQRALRDLEIEVTPPIALRASHVTAFSARQWIGAHAPGSPAFREMAAVAAALERLLRTCAVNDYAGAPPAVAPASAVIGAAGGAPAASRGGFLATLVAGLRLLGRPQSG